MSSKDKKKDKFNLEKYIEFDVDKTDIISIKESEEKEKEETKQSATQKTYSLLSFKSPLVSLANMFKSFNKF